MHLGIDASRAVTTQRTGTEGYAYHLLKTLVPLAQEAGHQVTLYFNQTPPPGFLPEAAHEVIPFPRLWTHLRLGWALRRQRPDLFFTPAHVIPLSYFGPSVATVTILAIIIIRAPTPASRWPISTGALCTTPAAAGASWPTPEPRGTTRAHLHIPREKIAVVYPGVDPSLAGARPGDVASVLAWYTIAGPYMLYLGTIQPRKTWSGSSPPMAPVTSKRAWCWPERRAGSRSRCWRR